MSVLPSRRVMEQAMGQETVDLMKLNPSVPRDDHIPMRRELILAVSQLPIKNARVIFQRNNETVAEYKATLETILRLIDITEDELDESEEEEEEEDEEPEPLHIEGAQ